MDDLRRILRSLLVCGFALAACNLSGCALFVMAGKTLFGDPKLTSAFKQATHVDLVKDNRTVVVVCSTPEAIRSEWTSLNVDLLDGVTRRLKTQGIDVVNPDKVARYLDDNGGSVDDPAELAGKFMADYIIHIDVERFTFLEDNSPTLYRGRTHGNVSAYEVKSVNGRKTARHVFDREFNSEYPEHNPIAADQMSPRVFQKRYMDRVCQQVAFLFYDHRMEEEIQ